MEVKELGKTKDKIIQCAIELFNQKGYENVSMREIAKVADTTIGNMTYHFSKKEDLLLVILENFHRTFLDGFVSEGYGIELLENTLQTFRKAKENQVENQFYFSNLYEITKGSETIKDINLDFQSQLMSNYFMRLVTLRKDGIVNSEASDETLRMISQIIIILTTVWGQSNLITQNVTHNMEPDDIVEYLVFLLKTVIDPEYAKEFDQLCIKIKEEKDE